MREAWVSDTQAKIASQNDVKAALTRFCLTILELQDASTYRHSLNVLYVARRIMDALLIEDRFREIVELGCLLHDIGKITVPLSLLRKKGAFDSEEYERVKGHTLAGHKIVEQIGQYIPAEVLEIILFHHEKNGGTGYPEKKPDIPLYVEIVAIADIAAAMQEHRYYRPGWPLDACVREIRKYRWSKGLTELVLARPDLLELHENDRAVKA
jgi:putative nucleotidyltransferase with HDIG domain